MTGATRYLPFPVYYEIDLERAKNRFLKEILELTNDEMFCSVINAN